MGDNNFDSNDAFLISLVKEREHLYNKQSKHSMDDQMKQNSWNDIGIKLNIDVELAKRRWHNLRDRFVRAHRVMSEQLPADPDFGDAGKSKFPYYDDMVWLIPHLRKRRLTASVIRAKQNASAAGSRGLYFSHPNDSTVTALGPNIKSTSDPLAIDLSSVSEEISWYDLETTAMSGGPSNEYASTPKTKAYLSEEELQSPTPSFISLGNSRPSSSSSGIEQGVNDKINTAVNTFSKLLEKTMDVKPVHNESSLNFMKSVASDMAILSTKNKILFKQEVMTLLVKYIDKEN